MDATAATRLIDHAVRTTQPRWSQYGETWAGLDRAFLARGYEQQGFQSNKLVEALEARGSGRIADLGEIWRQEDPTPYDREHAGGLDTRFYRSLREGERGKQGRVFYEAVAAFLDQKLGKAGSSFWQLLWWMLRACRYLRDEHEGSFRLYLTHTYRDFAGDGSPGEEDLRELDVASWQAFVNQAKPWKRLVGIGVNVFDFLVGDLEDARFASASYKLDTANAHFLTVTGIRDLIGSLERDAVIEFLNGLELEWSLREVNKGIYTYCSLTEAEQFGFCRTESDCARCEVRVHCGRRVRRVAGPGSTTPTSLEAAQARIAELEAENLTLRACLRDVIVRAERVIGEKP